MTQGALRSLHWYCGLLNFMDFMVLSSAPELRTDAAVPAHRVHGLLGVPVGRVPVFLPAERRRHCGHGSPMDKHLGETDREP